MGGPIDHKAHAEHDIRQIGGRVIVAAGHVDHVIDDVGAVGIGKRCG